MMHALLNWLQLKELIDQEKSEAVIALLTLLYQADGKIRLEEQDMFDQILESLPWQNNHQSKEVFHRDMIRQSLNALQENQLADYIAGITPALKSDPQVLAMLRELAVTDGEFAPKEAEILSLVVQNMV
jgi:uncharacterized tellurite resistance protein B-like protein